MTKPSFLAVFAVTLMLFGCGDSYEVKRVKAACEKQEQELIAEANRRIESLTNLNTEENKKIKAANQKKHMAATMYELCQQKPFAPFCFSSEVGKAAVDEGFTPDTSIFWIGNLAFAVFWTMVIVGIGWLLRLYFSLKTQKQVTAQQEKLASLQKEADAARLLKELIPGLERDHEMLTAEKSSLKAEIDQIKSDLLNQQNLASEARALRAEVSSLQDQVVEKRGEIGSLEDKKASLESALEEIRLQLERKKEEKEKKDEREAFKAAFL